MKQKIVTFTVALLVSALAGRLVLAQEQGTATTKTLYERLGGVYNIAAVVDDFIERIYVNETLNANPAIAGARKEVRKPGLKAHVTMMVCQVTGGPCTYVGKNMKETHANFGITEKEWAAMEVDFKASLDKFKVPTAEQQELFAIVGTTKPDIVVGATAKR